MKQIIVNAFNEKEYKGRKSPALLGLIYDDLIHLLRFIHQSQTEGILKTSFCFTNQIEYLDELWHHFILHTRLYHDFCKNELGDYLHHEPTPFPLEVSESKNINIYMEQLELLEKNLGRDFVQRIFFIYPEMLK